MRLYAGYPEPKRVRLLREQPAVTRYYLELLRISQRRGDLAALVDTMARALPARICCNGCTTTFKLSSGAIKERLNVGMW